MNRELGEQNLKVLSLEKLKQETEVKFGELVEENKQKFS